MSSAQHGPLVVPGMEPMDGGWRVFAALAPEAQLERIRPWLERLRAVDVAPVAERARLPLGEVVASPFGLRTITITIQINTTTINQKTQTLLN